MYELLPPVTDVAIEPVLPQVVGLVAVIELSAIDEYSTMDADPPEKPLVRMHPLLSVTLTKE